MGDLGWPWPIGMLKPKPTVKEIGSKANVLVPTKKVHAIINNTRWLN
jgi:hypothetical protein